MNLLVLSDLHLSPDTADRNQRFLRFLEQSLADGSEVLLLGDIFDLWFGGDSLTFPFQQAIILQMKRIAALGLKMVYVEGNRDFYIKRYTSSLFQSVSSKSYRRQWGNRMLHVEHGDWINVDDKPYRFFRTITKNKVAEFTFNHLPSSFLLKQAERLEKKMRNTNLKYKANYPEARCRQFVSRTAQEGADVIVVGHFHEEKSWEINEHGKTVLFFNLPGWESGFRYLVVPDSGEKPYFKEEGK